MTAKEIQSAIIKAYQKTDMVLPNFYLGLWECDVFRLQKNGFVIEYEIKITKSDFLADFKKMRKKAGGSINKHQEIAKGNRCNRFYFVFPKGVVDEKDIPPHCGYIVFDGIRLHTVKRAKLLNPTPVDEKYYKHLSYKLFYRLRDAGLLEKK